MLLDRDFSIGPIDRRIYGYACEDFDAVPVLDASAVLHDDGGVTIFAVNRDMEQAVELTCDLRAFGGLRLAGHILLHHDDVKAVNTEADPDRVSPVTLRDGALEGGRLEMTLPALSWNVIRLAKA